MADTDLTVRPATTADLDRVAALLAANDLPTRDLRSAPAQFFVARADGELVGCGGVEGHGDVGLLRSVAVAASHRGNGYGTALCDVLESRAQDAGVADLYLLTTSAAAFFRHRGYVELPREDAPSAIRETTEFAELCPDAATCLRKSL